jgi:hypothetical protein
MRNPLFMMDQRIGFQSIVLQLRAVTLLLQLGLLPSLKLFVLRLGVS